MIRLWKSRPQAEALFSRRSTRTFSLPFTRGCSVCSMAGRRKPLRLFSLVKTKEPKVIITDTWRVAREHSWLIATFAQVIRGIEMKLFYPNPIGGFGCFNCQYQEKCKEGDSDAYSIKDLQTMDAA